VEQQTQTMLTQQAAFALQRGELETRLEEVQHELQSERTKTGDALMEKQVSKEKFAFLEAQVDVLKEERRNMQEEIDKVGAQLAGHAQTSGILKQQLQEKEEERSKWEAEQQERELEMQLEHRQEMDALVENLCAKFRRENEAKEKELQDAHEREVLGLHKKCGLLQTELRSEKEKQLQDQEESQERYAGTMRDLEKNCAELEAQIAASKAERLAEAKQHEAKLAEGQEHFDAARRELERNLAQVQARLEAADVMAAESLHKLQDQEEARKRQTATLRDLEKAFADVQAQLAASEANMAGEARAHEEKLAEATQNLREQKDDQERHSMVLRDLEKQLEEAKAKLAGSEMQRLAEAKELGAQLAEASQVAAQHEKTARALAMEKKALQQEVRQVRQTAKLSADELLKWQSTLEQKTQAHSQSVARVQEQCESLETQLLSAEDPKRRPRAGKAVEESYSPKAFHGLTSAEIVKLPPQKAWALLRSGVNEAGDFLPQLQALLGAVHDTLKLCEQHADSLPALCERLQDKSSSEKGQRSTLSVALGLLSFATMLKARTTQQDSLVTPKLMQAFRRRLVEALAQWYECDAGDWEHGGDGSMPTPTFTITSRETALVLQNWTQDRTKQVGVRRWLARMEAYPGVPPLRGASSNRVLELPPEGCTLELEDMTPEVKDAFRLLLIPILKQNRVLHVRVFTRFTGGHEQKPTTGEEGNDGDAEKVWAMRIHVQSAVARRTRPLGSSRPAPLKLAPSPRGPPSPLAPTSPASSVSSSASSTASSRLQIIQERLQYLHNNV
jgi:hypothetical protein